VKRRLRWTLFAALAVLVLLAGTVALLVLSPAGPALAQRIAAAYLPEGVEIGTLSGRLAGGYLTLDRFRLAIGGITVDVRDVRVEFVPWPRGEGGWQVQVTSLSAEQVQVGYVSTGEPAGPPADGGTFAVPPAPVPIRLDAARVERFALQLQGETLLALSDVAIADGRWDRDGIGIADATVSARLQPDAPDGPLADARLQAEGRFDAGDGGEMVVRAALDGTVANLPQVTASAAATGTLARLGVSVTLDAPVRAQLDAELTDPLHALAATGTLRADNLSLQQLDQRLPPTDIDGSVALRFEDGVLVAAPDVTVQLDPPGPAAPAMLRVGGEASISRDALRAEQLSVRLEDPGVPPDRRAQVNATASLALAATDGERKLEASASWRNIDPGRLYLPTWSGRLDGQTRLALRLVDGARVPRARVDALELRGTLRGYPVALTGAGGFDGETITVRALRADSGTATARVDGALQLKRAARRRPDAALDLRFAVLAPDLSEVLPDGAGALRANGSLGGSAAAPTLIADVNGNDIALAGITVGAVTLGAEIDGRGEIDLNGEIVGVDARGQRVDRLKLTADGALAEHSIALEVIRPDATLQTGFDGQYAEQHWLGDFNELTLMLAERRWTLSQAPRAAEGGTLELGPGLVRLTPTCLADAKATVCARGSVEPAGEPGPVITAGIDVNALPIGPLAALFVPEYGLSGTASARATLRRDANGIEADADVTVSRGTLTNLLIDDGAPLISWQGATLSATVADQQVAADAKLDLGEFGRLDVTADTTLADDRPLTETPFQARIDGELIAPTSLAALSRSVARVGGRASVAVDIAGTPLAPIIDGELDARDLSAEITALGLDVADGTFAARFDRDSIRLEAGLDSGDGRLALEGDFARGDAGWGGTVDLTGERVLVANLPQVTAWISPALQTRIDPTQQLIVLTGTLTVPEARLRPLDLSGAVGVSADERIVGVEAPQAEGPGWQTQATLTLTLGDAVSFKGYGLNGRFGGSLTVDERPGETPIGNGELTLLDATFGAFGQVLTVERGRVVFVGSPLTNPGLDVLATRATRDDVTVRVDVRGTLREQEITISSDPPVPQADALSYLVLGRPVSSLRGGDGDLLSSAVRQTGLAGADLLAQQVGRRIGVDELGVESENDGQEATLVVGKYLSPRLYVRYGLGLFETINTWLLRYDLTERWSVETETGPQNSADVLYSIEN
jgi:translocation and assembly module TamB